jgi:4-amino-4-deoxy-L-arabinose transferase-like glycosyltransferase
VSSRSRDYGWALLAIALALRLGWIGVQWARQGPTLSYPDEELHWQLADNLAHQGTLVTNDGRFAARMPLYPLFLAANAGMGDDGIVVSRLLQAMLGAATVLVVYRFARAALGPRPALVAGILACIDPFAIFFSSLLLTEVLFTLWLVCLIALAWRLTTVHKSAWTTAIGVGLAGAACVMTRPSAIALLPLVWITAALCAKQHRRVTLHLLPAPLILVAALLPWGLRNHNLLGGYAWLSSNGGVTLYDAQGPQADGSSNQAFLTRVMSDPAFPKGNEIVHDKYLTNLALENMRRDPARVLHLAGVKFLRTWNLRPNVSDGGPAAAIASAAYTALLLIGAAVAIVRAARRRPASTRRPIKLFLLWVGLPVVYFTLLHCLYIGSVRYRVPVMPLVALAAGAALAGPITHQPTPQTDQPTR